MLSINPRAKHMKEEQAAVRYVLEQFNQDGLWVEAALICQGKEVTTRKPAKIHKTGDDWVPSHGLTWEDIKVEYIVFDGVAYFIDDSQFSFYPFGKTVTGITDGVLTIKIFDGEQWV